MKHKIKKTNLLLFLFPCLAYGQRTDTLKWTPHLKGDFTFTHHWNYPPYIMKYKKSGRFVNLMTGEKIKGQDTDHLYQTCNCSTDFQGGDTVKYCDANLKNDTLLLTFCGANISEHLVVKVYEGLYQSRFYYTYEARPRKGHSPNFQSVTNDLTIDHRKFYPGLKIKGKIKVSFSEDDYTGEGTKKLHYYILAGLFATKIKKDK